MYETTLERDYLYNILFSNGSLSGRPAPRLEGAR